MGSGNGMGSWFICTFKFWNFRHRLVRYYRYYNNLECRPTHTDKNMAACFSRVPFLRAQPRQVTTSSFRVSEFSVISKILEQKLWPFNVKGFVMCKAPEDRRSAQICLLTVDSHCQSICKVCVQCQSSILCGAELLTARHLICASKRFFGCQICTAIL